MHLGKEINQTCTCVKIFRCNPFVIVNICISNVVASAVAVKNHSQSLEVLMPELDFIIRDHEAEKILQILVQMYIL